MDVSIVFMADILPMWQSAASAHLCCEWAMFDPFQPVANGRFAVISSSRDAAP